MSACSFFHVSPNALAKWSSTDGVDERVDVVDLDEDVVSMLVGGGADATTIVGDSARVAAATWVGGGDCSSGGLTGLMMGLVVKAWGRTADAAGGVGEVRFSSTGWCSKVGATEAIGGICWGFDNDDDDGGGGVGVGVGEGVDGTGDFFPKRAT